jgi:hypothetical protein
MKKAIDLIDAAKGKVYDIDYDDSYRDRNEVVRDECIDLLDEAIAELKNPRWETPEQWEKRTGNKYPEDAAVRIFYSPEHGWDLMEYWRAKQLEQDLARLDKDFDVDPKLIPIVCDCGVDGPPPYGWKPEEETK